MKSVRPESSTAQSQRVCPIVLAFLAVAVWAGSVAGENRIYMRCSDASGSVTEGDMIAGSIGTELAAVADPDHQYPYSALVLSYHEGGLSTYLPDGSGDFQHGGITVVRPVANSSPAFWKALTIGAPWTECILNFTRRTQSSDVAEIYFRITISDTVLITQIETRAVAQLASEGTGQTHLETITFAFGRIGWETFGEGATSWLFDLEEGPVKKETQ